MPLINELKPQEAIKGIYLCKFKQQLKNKNGKDYYTIRLQDRTGMLDGKIWAIHSGIGAFEVDDIIEVEGETLLYQENLQLNITKVQKVEEGYDLKAFLPHTKKDVNQLEERLMQFIDQVENNYLKKLLEAIFYEDTLFEAFSKHSGGKTVHHAYLNGLLEHTVTVTEIGVHMAKMYDHVTLDYVIAGCLLHDIGKLKELTAFPKNDYSDEGQLLGHLMIGCEMVHDTARTIEGFPEEIERILKHILIAHHGEYEYGSPKRPKCMEAMIVHLADYSDSRLKMMEEMLDSSHDEPYAGYHKILTRNIRKVSL
ncbi:MAG: HD domain-containing protein [Cellulosilyticum sp.]|nr:HD domain-containing protein [Cellulosilyticum sp.]